MKWYRRRQDNQHCNQCGRLLWQGSRYCNACGAAVPVRPARQEARDSFDWERIRQQLQRALASYLLWLGNGGFWTRVAGIGGPALAVLIVINAVGGGSDEPTSSTSRTQSGQSASISNAVPSGNSLSSSDVAGIRTAAEGFFVNFNTGSMVDALRYVSTSAARECGGITNLGSAYVQLKQLERTTYEFVSVKVYEDGRADITLDLYLTGGNKSDLVRIKLGYQFVEEGRWVFASPPLRQVMSFC